MIWFGVAMVFMAILVTAGIRHELSWDRTNNHLQNNVKAIEQVASLSWASREILREYNALPDMHKQWGDIVPMLQALDLKYDGYTDLLYEKQRNRYSTYMPDHVEPNYVWMSMETDNEYRVLHHKIEQVRRALVRQQEALDKKAHDDKVAGVAGHLADVQELTERLRREADIIDAATEEACSS